MAVTILGANGKIGRVLSHYANNTGLGWRTQARRTPADIVWSGDMTETKAIFQAGDTIINMVGQTGSDTEVLHAVNVKFVADLLARAAAAGVAHVVLASSAAVYGNGAGDYMTEDAALAPVSRYGESKAEMEDIVHAAAGGPAITILRIGNIAGSDALTRFAKRHNDEGTSMDLHRLPDGTTPVRSYIGPSDLFRTIRDLSEPHSDGVRTLNVAHPQPVTLEDVLRGYKAHLMPDLKWADNPAPEGTIARAVLSTERLETYVTFDRHQHPADAFAAQVAESLTQ